MINSVSDNTAPEAYASYSHAVITGDTVQVSGWASDDPDGDTLTYQWQFTDKPVGSTAAFNSSQILSPDFVADKAGTYTLQLKVSDGIVLAVITGDIVQVSGWASDDPDGDTLSYQWQITDKPSGSTAAFNNSQIHSPDFVADNAGSYTIQLKVSDGIVVSEPHAITITATDGHADLPPDPGDAGKQTLLGIDSDVDGVRDDIQRHIWATYPGNANVNIRNALSQITKHFVQIFSDIMSPLTAYQHAIQSNANSECLAYHAPNKFPDYAESLLAKTLNTKDRFDLYFHYSEQLEGQFFMSNPSKQWKQNCAF